MMLWGPPADEWARKDPSLDCRCSPGGTHSVEWEPRELGITPQEVASSSSLSQSPCYTKVRGASGRVTGGRGCAFNTQLTLTKRTKTGEQPCSSELLAICSTTIY